MSERNLFAELKRRTVAIRYVVASWLIIEAASLLFRAFDAAPSTLKIVVVVLVLGFPVVLAFSWAFEITPQRSALHSTDRRRSI